MDGIRAYWNGASLFTRRGNIIHCPNWFTSKLPVEKTLDGELWMGSGTSFENINAISKTKNGDWQNIKYCVFDIPSSTGTIEERMAELQKLVVPPHVQIVEQRLCKGKEDLLKYLDSVVASKGEGVMLREPHSRYIPELTPSLLKVKVMALLPCSLCRNLKIRKWKYWKYWILGFIADSNIFQHHFNTNRQDGLTCTVKYFEGAIPSPPPVGSTVTVKHNGAHPNGLLNNPTYWRHLDSTIVKPVGYWGFVLTI